MNLNPNIEKSLTLFHTSLLRLLGYGKKIKVYDNGIRETHWKDSPDILTGIRTRCNSDHLDTSIALANQSDLEIVLAWMI